MASTQSEEAHAPLLPQLGMMVRALLGSAVGRTIVLLSLSLLAVIVLTAYGQIRLNRWNKPFYDAISRRDLLSFLYELGVFCIIGGSLLVLNVAQAWVQEMITLKLREGLVRDLLYEWMQPRRALMLANAGAIGVNPDQRMHEDARRLCELSTQLASGLLQSSILLVTFIGVLWVLSRGFAVHVAGQDLPIPGYMVWASLIYASFASLLSYRVGRTLIPKNAQRYQSESDLRFSLVRVNEHLDGISLARGESGELRRVELHLTDVLGAMRRLVTGLTNLTWVTAGFGWVTLVAPLIIASPLYFQGTLSFGGLMMAVGALNQAQSSLNWFVNNFSSIADWRAILLRVANFRRALLMAEAPAPEEQRIEYVEGEPGLMLLENLQIASATDRDVLEEPVVQIRTGERLVVLAEPGTGKTRLFRALAGLWPWGSGRIARPAGESILYLPRGTPYLPRGSLREVLAYPAAVDAFAEPSYAQALRRVGLARLVPVLDQTHRWDRELSQEEQVSLAFARISLQRPPWLVIDDALGSLEAELLERVIDILTHELEHSSVIHIGAVAGRAALFPRTVRLIKPGGSHRLLRPVALALCLMAFLPLLAHAAAAPRPPPRPLSPSGQDFEFRAPSVLNDAATSMLMRDLAVRVLPVYADPDRTRYLTNLSALQMVAGDFPAADATRQTLRNRLHGASVEQLPQQSIAYDIYARTETLAQRHRMTFGQAFAQSFDTAVMRLDNRTDYAVTAWFQVPLDVFREQLLDTLHRLPARGRISLPQALQLVWTYLAFQVHLSTGPQADVLILADEQRRYLMDQTLVRTPSGAHVAVVVMRPRVGNAKLPALLQYSLETASDSAAKEAAAHTYVGVIAYRPVQPHSRHAVLPYQSAGADARAVIGWIARQPWSDGRVAMIGSGYSAFAGWAAASRPVHGLVALALASPVAPGINAPRLGNIFLNSAYPWALQAEQGLMPGELSEEQDPSRWLALDRRWYVSGRPYVDLPRLGGTASPLFERWLAHPSYDAFWQRMLPSAAQLAHLDIPVLQITGYFDPREPGALFTFSEHQRYDQHAQDTLVIGPYDGSAGQPIPGRREARGLRLLADAPRPRLRGYEPDAASDLDWHELRFQWLDAVLRGRARPALLDSPVVFELMGQNQWRKARSVTAMAGGSMRLYFAAARSDLSAGFLSLAARTPRTDAIVGEQRVDFTDRSDADWLPPQALASRTVSTHNSLVFASAPLPRATAIAGRPSGRLEVAINELDFDFSLALYARRPDGSYLKLADPPDQFRASYAGDRRHRRLLRRGQRVRLNFDSEHLLGALLPAGTRLIAVLSVVKRPDEQINYGTGRDVSRESIADAHRPLTLRWYADSYLDLPLAAEGPAARAPQQRAPTRPARAPTAAPRAKGAAAPAR